jgi:NAD dependent epimerase/dehydratase
MMKLNNKKIAITGADGFIGSHLTELLSRNNDVRALSYYNSFNHWGWLEDIPKNSRIEIESGDIRDPHFCKAFVRDVDIIFHLAALIAIPYSYMAPDSYVDTNIKGTLNICQAARENGKIPVIHTSTSEVYGTAQYVPIDEKHPKKPQSPYSASKIGADMIALSFFNAFELPVTVARPFNTFGPRQSARAIIPAVITQLAAGKKEIKAGDTRPTRDFNFVADTCQGFIALAESQAAIGQEVNIASGFEISIADTIRLIAEIMNVEIHISLDKQRLRPEKSEVFRLFGSNERLKTLTGYKPTTTFPDGLRQTIDWFTRPENLAKYKSDIYNV